MPEVGVEPTHPCGYGILSPARLPVSPLRPGSVQDSNVNLIRSLCATRRTGVGRMIGRISYQIGYQTSEDRIDHACRTLQVIGMQVRVEHLGDMIAHVAGRVGCMPC